MLPPGESPFRGLLTFDTADALLFFGRDGEVDELLHRLPDTHFLPVVGDSGSGKSSLVRAGLIPALLRGRLSDRGALDWRIATMNSRTKNTTRTARSPAFSGRTWAGSW